MNANDKLLDLTVSHLVDLQSYSTGVVRRLSALLNRADADLFSQLTQALDNLPPQSFTVERLESLLVSVRQLNLSAYQVLERELTDELRNFAEVESVFQAGVVRAAIPAEIVGQVSIARVSAQVVYTAAFSQPFRGRLLREWAKSIEADRMVRIRDAVRLGYVESQTVQQIVNRIRGTRAKGYKDGIIEIDRRNAAAVATTAISHVAGVARDQFMAANSGSMKAVVWVATLDARTSELCRIRDGLNYTAETHRPIGHKIPWLAGPGRLHWRCRSCSAPVLKSWRELGLTDLPPSTRASMDGQVPEDLTYAKWLKRQSAARQDEILGETRGRLMRSGGLDLEQFYTDRGVPLTLQELAEKNAAAFKAAGVPLPA